MRGLFFDSGSIVNRILNDSSSRVTELTYNSFITDGCAAACFVLLIKLKYLFAVSMRVEIWIFTAPFHLLITDHICNVHIIFIFNRRHQNYLWGILYIQCNQLEIVHRLMLCTLFLKSRVLILRFVYPYMQRKYFTCVENVLKPCSSAHCMLSFKIQLCST